MSILYSIIHGDLKITFKVTFIHHCDLPNFARGLAEGKVGRSPTLDDMEHSVGGCAPINKHIEE